METPELQEDVTSPVSSDSSHSFGQGDSFIHDNTNISIVTESQNENNNNVPADGDQFTDPRPASKPEKHVIYKSMNFLPFTTRFEMLKTGSSMRLVDLNPRQAVRIYDDRPPEFSHKKCRVLKYVTMPSDTSSSSDCSYSSEDSSEEADCDHNNNSILTSLDCPAHGLKPQLLPIFGMGVDLDHLSASVDGDTGGMVPALGMNVDIDQVSTEDEEVDVIHVSESQVSEAAEILLSMSQSRTSGEKALSRDSQIRKVESKATKNDCESCVPQPKKKRIVLMKNRDHCKTASQTSGANVSLNSPITKVYNVPSADRALQLSDTSKMQTPTITKYGPLEISQTFTESGSASTSEARQGIKIEPNSFGVHQGQIHQRPNNFWTPLPFQSTSLLQQQLHSGFTDHTSNAVQMESHHLPSASTSWATNAGYLLSPTKANDQSPQQTNLTTFGTPGPSNHHISVVRVISSPRSMNNLQAKFNNEALLCKNKPALGEDSNDVEPDFESFANTWHALTVDVAGNSVHKCILCGKIYTIYQAYQNHVQLHFKQRNKCTVCGKSFSRPWLLKGHMRTHTGERPYKCDHPGCVKAFADRSNLRSHMMIHKSKGKEYTCTSCDRAFAQKRYLHKHMAEVCKATVSPVPREANSPDQFISSHTNVIHAKERNNTNCVLGQNLQKLLPKEIRKQKT